MNLRKRSLSYILVLAQLLIHLSSAAIENLALNKGITSFPTNCNGFVEPSFVVDGICGSPDNENETCRKSQITSRVWIDLGQDERIRTVVVLESLNTPSDTKVIRGCNSATTAGTDGANFDSTSCFDCGAQTGLADNYAMACDMTVQYLFVYLAGTTNAVLSLNEVLAFREANIGLTSNFIATSVTVTLSPGTLDAMAGDNIWRNTLILLAGDTGDGMLATTTAGTSANTYIRLTFTTPDQDSVMIGAVLVIGRAGAEADRALGVSTSVVAIKPDTTEFVCQTGISDTCSLNTCNTSSTALEIRKTIDNESLSIGGVVVLECIINTVTSTNPGNHIYQQGDPALQVPFSFTLTAECLQEEWYEYVNYQFAVSRDNVPVIGTDYFRYETNFITEILDITEMVEETTYQILLGGTIANTYSDNYGSFQNFLVTIKNYCYQRGSQATFLADNISNVVHKTEDPGATYSMYSSLADTIDSVYPTCYDFVSDTSNCDASAISGIITIDIDAGTVAVAQQTAISGECTITLSLESNGNDSTQPAGVVLQTYDITVSVESSDCTTTIGYDSAVPIVYYLGTGALDTDLLVSVADPDLCPAPTASSFICNDQTFCTTQVSYVQDGDAFVLRVDAELSDVQETGTLTVLLKINPNQNNEATITLTVQLVDPCEGRNTVTLASDLGWDSEVWITESVVFAVDPDTQISSVTNPPGANCGPFSVNFALTDQNGNPAPNTATITITEYSITINFNFDTSTTGNWDISVTAYQTNYPDISNGGTNAADSQIVTFAAKNPCQESTIAVNNAAVNAAWPATQSIHVSEAYAFVADTMATATIAGPNPDLDCGALVVTFTLSPDDQYLSTTSDTATVDFAGATSAVGQSWALGLSVRFNGYSSASDPVGTYSYSITATDPCNSADALTLGTAYINSLQATYDLFEPKQDYTWDATQVATFDGTSVTESFCGALTVTLAYASGPSDVFTVVDSDSYYLFGSDPTDAPSTLVLTFTASLADYPVTSKSQSFSYGVTNTCANVVITEGPVYEDGVATTEVFYENGADSVVLTFDDFPQDIAYCPVIYTVHMLTIGGDEVTWNREDNPLTSDPAYDAVPNSDFSSQPPSSEYLTISRPADGNQGTITIANTGDIDTYVGSYLIQLRAHHQDVTAITQITYEPSSCDVGTINLPENLPTIDFSANGTTQVIYQSNLTAEYSDTTCIVETSYSVTLKDGSPLPDYLVHNSTENSLTYNGEWPSSATGYQLDLIIKVVVTFLDVDNTTATVYPTISIDYPVTPQGPVFTEELSPDTAVSGEAWSYELPTISDTSGASISTIQFDIEENDAADFVQWDEDTKTLSINAGDKTVTVNEYYKIDITLTDELGFSNSFEMILVVEPAPVVESDPEPTCDCASTDDACADFLQANCDFAPDCDCTSTDDLCSDFVAENCQPECDCDSTDSACQSYQEENCSSVECDCDSTSFECAQYRLDNCEDTSTTDTDTTPVAVTDSNVDDTGTVEMNFNKDLVVPSDLQDIFDENTTDTQTSRRLNERYSTNTTYYRHEREIAMQALLDSKNEAELTQDERLKRFDLTAYSKIEIVEGAIDSAEWQELAIAPYLTNFTKRKIAIDLQFAQPLSVSHGAVPDYVIFTLTDNTLFIDAETGKPIDYFTEKLYLPKLIDTNNPEDVKEVRKFEAKSEKVGQVTNTLIMVIFIVSLLLSLSLKGLWIFLHFIQVVFYLKYYGPNVPANMRKMFDSMFNAVHLPFLGYKQIFGGIDTWADQVMGISEEAEKIKVIRKEGSSLVDSTGLYLLAILIVLILIVIWIMLKLIVTRTRCMKPKLQKTVNYLQHRIFYSAFLRIMITGSLSFDHIICLWLYLQVNADEEHKNKSMTAVIIVCFVIMVLIPPVLGFLLLKYRHRLQEKIVLRKFDSTYLTVRTNHKKTTLYTPVFMFRRLLLALVACTCQSLRNWLALAFVIQQMAYLIYLIQTKAHEQPSFNKLELFNEVILLIFSYFLILTTDYVTDVTIQYDFGWFAVYMIIITVFINMISMILATLYQGFFVKKHKQHLKTLQMKREVKIAQINASKATIAAKMQNNEEYQTLQNSIVVQSREFENALKKKRTVNNVYEYSLSLETIQEEDEIEVQGAVDLSSQIQETIKEEPEENSSDEDREFQGDGDGPRELHLNSINNRNSIISDRSNDPLNASPDRSLSLVQKANLMVAQREFNTNLKKDEFITESDYEEDDTERSPNNIELVVMDAYSPEARKSESNQFAFSHSNSMSKMFVANQRTLQQNQQAAPPVSSRDSESSFLTSQNDKDGDDAVVLQTKRGSSMSVVSQQSSIRDKNTLGKKLVTPITIRDQSLAYNSEMDRSSNLNTSQNSIFKRQATHLIHQTNKKEIQEETEDDESQYSSRRSDMSLMSHRPMNLSNQDANSPVKLPPRPQTGHKTNSNQNLDGSSGPLFARQQQ